MTFRALSAILLLAALAGLAVQHGWPAALAAAEQSRLPMRLADTGLHVAGQPDTLDARNRLFAPQYPLWSDGLSKRRWIQLPVGTTIDASDLHAWRFPVGTKLWKEFSHTNRRIETRMLWKTSDEGWTAATYAWNDDGTEAMLAPDDGIPGVVEVASGRRHGIPSRSDCAACHGSRLEPLGFNALQLSPDRDPNAIHAEPLAAGMITLRTLMEEGLLRGAPDDLLASPPRIRTTSPATRAVLGYLVANCGSCHNGRGEISAEAPTLTCRELTDDGDAVARRLVGHVTRWQVPGTADGESVLVRPGAPEASALLVRMRSRAPSSQMPPLGTVVRDQAAVDALEQWIASEIAAAR
jgi:hypothetical protein